MTMLTEDEAKTKWCPYFRTAIAKVMSENPEWTTNRDHRPEINNNCLASACMAWRVAEQGFKRERTDQETENRFREAYRDRLTIEPHNWPSSGYDTLVVHALGYCGAFSTPHLVGVREN